MQFIMLITEAESRWADIDEKEAGEVIGRYMQWGKEVGEAGKLLGGERLQPTHTATTVRVRDGETMLSDGPFAETKEQLGGFYLVEADDLDDAIAMAAKIPAAETGSVEVRPVWIME